LTYLNGGDSISGAGVTSTVSAAIQASAIQQYQGEIGEPHSGVVIAGSILLPGMKFVTHREAQLESQVQTLQEQLRLVTEKCERETRRANLATKAAYYRETGQTDEYANDGWGERGHVFEE
jgi:hypothetical protein